MKWAHITGVFYNKRLTRAQKAELIEYWLNNPGIRMKDLATKFETNEHTASTIISRDYLGYLPKNPVTITLQSKLNFYQPEQELTTIE